MERGWCPGIGMGSLWNTICRSHQTSHQSRYCQMALFATKSIPCVAATGGSCKDVGPPHSFLRWRVALLVPETYLAAISTPWVQNHSQPPFGKKRWACSSGPTIHFGVPLFLETPICGWNSFDSRFSANQKVQNLQDFFHESFVSPFRRPCGACAFLSASAKGTGGYEAMKWWCATEDGTPALMCVVTHYVIYPQYIFLGKHRKTYQHILLVGSHLSLFEQMIMIS